MPFSKTMWNREINLSYQTQIFIIFPIPQSPGLSYPVPSPPISSSQDTELEIKKGDHPEALIFLQKKVLSSEKGSRMQNICDIYVWNGRLGRIVDSSLLEHLFLLRPTPQFSPLGVTADCSSLNPARLGNTVSSTLKCRWRQTSFHFVSCWED